MKLMEKLNIINRKIPKTIKILLIFIVGIGTGYIIYNPSNDLASNNQDTTSSPVEVVKEDNCNIVGVNIHGTIMTYIPKHAEGDTLFNYDTVGSENILGTIKLANEDPKIKAIVVEVDSNGGYPVAGEEIGNAIKNSKKPIVGLIRENGLSAAYWAISGANRIWASKNSTVGSIGVTQSYLNNVEKNKKDGYTLEQLSSGKFKDSGSANASLTEEERALFMRDINIVYQNFMQAVSTNRNIPLDKIKKFADGSTVLGDKAKELGLIDEIGGIPEVEQYLQEKIGEKPEICWE